ncbi:bifunctional N(6)-L-threonylcarbamoyladenine synthase/serine/threonine protein kinase [Candidatus Woesearchaeota archaeon]|nr:bifunctional N(6)-L-threonylcarbamoyladenine synthase/serine/threonine protein kinase [Candidatus Woesearchaeota archaeon]
MIVLGIESTAHTFGIAILKDKEVLSNHKSFYTTESGGIIPNELKEHHNRVKNDVLKESLEKANIKLEDIELISFSQSPGMAPALHVGCNFAKELAKKLKIPIIGVNHCVAHLEIGRMLFPECKDPVLLYASGANTQIIAYDGGKYRIFGETLDNGIGNALDSFGRHLGLGFPQGPKIEKLASASKNYIEIPYCVKGMDVNFGGILTNLKQKYNSKKYSTDDLCFSLQETVFAMLVEVSERAMAHCEKKELLLGGGVACNKRLQEMCDIMCRERGAKSFVPANQFLVDNPAMIAWLGLIEYNSGVRMSIDDIDIKPYERTDDINVTWR